MLYAAVTRQRQRRWTGRELNENESGVLLRHLTSPPTMGLTRIWRRGIQWDEMLASRKGQLKLLTLACMLWVLLCGGVNMNVNESGDFWDGIWEAWTYMSDAGTHA